jgi:hypothetical protein
MGIRLEIVLLSLVGFIIGGALTIEVNKNFDNNAPLTKELEFSNTTFVEVDSQRLLGSIYGTYGIRNSGVLSLEDVVYYTDSIKLLTAKKANFEGDTLNLDLNVSVEDYEGTIHKTQHATYNQKTQILELKTAFVSLKDKNIFKGNSLVYNAANKEILASKVDAVLYTADK